MQRTRQLSLVGCSQRFRFLTNLIKGEHGFGLARFRLHSEGSWNPKL